MTYSYVYHNTFPCTILSIYVENSRFIVEISLSSANIQQRLDMYTLPIQMNCRYISKRCSRLYLKNTAGLPALRTAESQWEERCGLHRLSLDQIFHAALPLHAYPFYPPNVTS